MNPLHLLLCAPLLSSSFAKAGEKISYAGLVSRLTDLERLAEPIVEGEKTFASTSHDRASRYNEETDRYENWAANGDGGGGIRREGDAQVMVDLDGAGVIWRTWSAKPERGHIRIYIDCYDEKVTTTGEISLGTHDLKAGKHTLRATLVGSNNDAKNAVGVGKHLFGLDCLRLTKL